MTNRPDGWESVPRAAMTRDEMLGLEGAGWDGDLTTLRCDDVELIGRPEPSGS